MISLYSLDNSKESSTKPSELKVKKCSNCKEPGHNISKCPKVKTNLVDKDSLELDNSKESPIKPLELKIKRCSKCKEPGHNIRKCPQK